MMIFLQTMLSQLGPITVLMIKLIVYIIDV